MNTTDANPIGLTALAGAPPWVWAALKLTLLLLAVWTVHIGLRRSNPRWRILLWRGALVWLAVLPALIVAGPKWPVATMKMATAVPAVATPGSTDPATGNSLPTTDWAPTVGASPALAPPVVPNRPTAAWTEILMGIWLAGLAWLLSRAGWGHRRVRQLARSSAPARAATSAECARIAMALRCRLPVSVRVHAQIHTPVLLGLQRPAILLPAAMGEPGFEAELPGVLAHELAHLISRDLWWSTALHYLSLGLWFHPLFWGVRAAHDAACEKVSDATAARVVGNARSYSRTLARIALSAVRGPRILAAVPMAGSGGIRQRLEALEDHPFCEELPPRRVAAGVLIGCVMLLGLASATIGLETAPAIAAEPGKPDAKNTSPLTPTTNTDPELDERVLELLRRAQAAVGKDHEGYGKAMNDLLSLGPRVAPSLAARLRPPPPGLTSTSEANALSFQARVMLQEMGSAAQPALPKLIQGLRDGRGETYALILGEMGPAAKLAVPALVAKAQSGCAEAAVALARIDPESPATLAALLQIMRARDRISNDISSLAWAFQLLGPRAAPAVPALAEVLSDEVPDHQEAAVRALSHIGTPEAVTALRGVLHHANGQARVRAAETVLKHHAGDAEAAAVLQAGLRDADARVRGGAVSAVSGARRAWGLTLPRSSRPCSKWSKMRGRMPARMPIGRGFGRLRH